MTIKPTQQSQALKPAAHKDSWEALGKAHTWTHIKEGFVGGIKVYLSQIWQVQNWCRFRMASKPIFLLWMEPMEELENLAMELIPCRTSIHSLRQVRRPSCALGASARGP